MNARLRILFVDDQYEDYPFVPAALLRRGIEVLCEAQAARTIPRMEKDAEINLVLLDLLFEAQPVGGEEVFVELRRLYENVPVIILTSRDSIASQQDYLRRGAAGYIYKSPEGLNVDDLATAIELAAQRSRLIQLLDRGHANRIPIGESPAFRGVMAQLERAAPLDSPVLFSGESGTGKSFFARLLHSRSLRRHEPLFTTQSNLPSSTLEREVFGDSGPGLLELTAGGTLVLEDAEHLPASTAARLHDALERGTVQRADPGNRRRLESRLMFTVEFADALKEVSPALYYRLVPHEIQVPPLRGRREDIPALAEHFLRHCEIEQNLLRRDFASDAMAALCRRSWAGNVAELRMVVRRGAGRAEEGRITEADLGLSGSPFFFNRYQQSIAVLDGRRNVLTLVQDLDDSFDRARDAELARTLRTMIRIFHDRHGRAPQLQELLGTRNDPEKRKRIANMFSQRLSRMAVGFRDLVREELGGS